MLLSSFTAPYPVDTVTACPLNVNNLHLFAVGCYKLENATRHGGVQLGLVHCTEHRCFLYNAPFFSLPYGVLDAALHLADDRYGACMLSMVGADGGFHLLHVSISNFSLDCSEPLITIDHTSVLYGSEKRPAAGAIGVAMDIIGQAHKTFTYNELLTVAWSLSNGWVHHSSAVPARPLTTDSEVQNIPTTSWRAHDAEVWTVAVDPHCPDYQVITGGDDCLFKFWDLRCGVTQPVTINRSHTMGVTVATFDRENDNVFLTGSYDGMVRIWDRRHMRSPCQTHATDNNDGVWRIKIEERNAKTQKRDILIAATHSGCEVWSTDSSWADVVRVGSHTSHKSMAYGIASLGSRSTADSGLDPNHSQRVYMSGSFYDNHVAVWELP